eukprot:scaffold20693_cov76-Phaeocystis_antarctica.AAC.4
MWKIDYTSGPETTNPLCDGPYPIPSQCTRVAEGRRQLRFPSALAGAQLRADAPQKGDGLKSVPSQAHSRHRPSLDHSRAGWKSDKDHANRPVLQLGDFRSESIIFRLQRSLGGRHGGTLLGDRVVVGHLHADVLYVRIGAVDGEDLVARHPRARVPLENLVARVGHQGRAVVGEKRAVVVLRVGVRVADPASSVASRDLRIRREVNVPAEDRAPRTW